MSLGIGHLLLSVIFIELRWYNISEFAGFYRNWLQIIIPLRNNINITRDFIELSDAIFHILRQTDSRPEWISEGALQTWSPGYFYYVNLYKQASVWCFPTYITSNQFPGKYLYYFLFSSHFHSWVLQPFYLPVHSWAFNPSCYFPFSRALSTARFHLGLQGGPLLQGPTDLFLSLRLP